MYETTVFSLFTFRNSFPSMNLVIDSRTRSAALWVLQIMPSIQKSRRADCLAGTRVKIYSVIQYTVIQLYSLILKGIVSTIYSIINIYICIYINNKVFSKNGGSKNKLYIV